MSDLNTMEPILLVSRLVQLRRDIRDSWDRVSELKNTLPEDPRDVLESPFPSYAVGSFSEETERVMGLITAEMDRAYEMEYRERECMEIMMSWNVEEVLYQAGVDRFNARGR